MKINNISIDESILDVENWVTEEMYEELVDSLCGKSPLAS